MNPQEMPEESRARISEALLILTQEYWKFCDAKYKGTALTPPLNFATLVKDTTGQGRHTSVSIQMQRVTVDLVGDPEENSNG